MISTKVGTGQLIKITQTHHFISGPGPQVFSIIEPGIKPNDQAQL